jgi:hypothetical protein
LEILQNFPSVRGSYIKSSGTSFFSVIQAKFEDTVCHNFRFQNGNKLFDFTHTFYGTKYFYRHVNSFILVLLTVFNLFLEPVIHIFFQFF